MKKTMNEAEARLLRAMRLALENYDRASATSPDRHPERCPCGYCEFVRAGRSLVNDYDFDQHSPEEQ